MARRLVPALLLLCAATAGAQSLPAPTPRAVDQTLTLPTGSAAAVGGADSTLVNPAGLSYTGGLELDYLHQRSALNDRTGDGAYLALDTGGLALGFSLEWLRFGPGSGPHFRRTTWALSLGGEALSLGAAYHIYGGTESPFFDHLTSWDVGIIARPVRALSLGFSVLDVDAPEVGRISLPRRYDVGLGLRPFGERLTVSADLLVGDNAGFDHGALGYALRWRALDGVTLFGGLTHYYKQGELAGTVGLQLDGPHVGLAYAAGANSGLDQMEHTIGVRLSTARHPSMGESGQVALLDLGELLKKEDGLVALLGGGQADPYLTTLELLRRAKSDTAISGVVLKFGDLEGGLGSAHVQEMRQAITALHDAGKPVIALLTNADDSDYFLASACDRIYAVPEATLLINGLSWSTVFLGESLARLGVRVEVARVGAYKNAPDQLTRTDMSPEQREAEETFLKTVWTQYEDAVTSRRKLDKAKFDAAIGHGILTPQQAKELGLIDDVAFPDDLEKLAGDVLGRKATLVRDYDDWERAPDRWSALPKVALVRIAGTIVDGKSSSGLGGAVAGSETLVKGIDAARDDASVKAIVIRVDSPGGSGNASNLIERAIEKAREKKPVVVSMGDTAASGGYYVAVGGDAIWAEPTTLTGSIGVFVIKPDLSGLLGKLSVHDVTIKQGDRADIFSFTQPWTEGEQAAMQGYADAFYDRFITLVAQRRKLDKAKVDRIARGRIWSGADAKSLGLVDQLGSLDDAIQDAKKRAGLDGDERVELAIFGSAKSLLPGALLETHTHAEAGAVLRELGLGDTAADTFSALRLAQTPGVVAALPFSYRLH